MVDGYNGFIMLDKNDSPKAALHIENEMRRAKKYQKLHPDKALPHITPYVFRHTCCTRMKFILLGIAEFMLAGILAAGTFALALGSKDTETSVYKGYKQDKIEMRGDRAEMSDFPLYLNTVAGGLDRRDQTIGGFSFVVKIYALPVVEIIG